MWSRWLEKSLKTTTIDSPTRTITRLFGNDNWSVSKRKSNDNNIWLYELAEDTKGEKHSPAAKLLFLSQRGRPDVQTATSFRCTRMKESDTDGFKKLTRMMQYLRATKIFTSNFGNRRYRKYILVSGWCTCCGSWHERSHRIDDDLQTRISIRTITKTETEYEEYYRNRVGGSRCLHSTEFTGAIFHKPSRTIFER